MSEEYLLPDDYVEDTTDTDVMEDTEVEDVETEETTEVETEQPETQPIESGFKLPYKFNHQDGELTDIEEAKNLVQLGLLYKSKEPELNEYKSKKAEVEKLTQIAELYGMTADELHESLYNQYLESQAEATGYTPEQIRKDRELADKERILTAKEQTEKQKQQNYEMYDKFKVVYPDVDIAKGIKPETWAAVDKGIDLITAYTMQRNNELQEQLKISTQNTTNKKSSPAVGTTKIGSTDSTKEDDFLDGLFGRI